MLNLEGLFLQFSEKKLTKGFTFSQSYTPEIFILPATHDSVARPVENAANTVIQTHGMTTGNCIIGINLRVYQWSNAVYYHEILVSCHSVFTLMVEI